MALIATPEKVKTVIAKNLIDKAPFLLISFFHKEPLTLDTNLTRDQLYQVQNQLNRLVQAKKEEGDP